MKNKHKLSIWVTAIVSAAVAGITILLLHQASIISLNSSIRSMEHLVSYQAEFCKDWEDSYIQTLHTLANVMGNYETIQAEERRDRYDELLKSAMEEEPEIVLLYTVWKPNAIDGMDKQFIGRTGSSPTGQYAMTYNKETGIMVKQVSVDIEGSMTYITGPDARKDRIDNPILRKISGTDKYTIRMMVPIINNSNSEVVGTLGCLLVIDVIQQALENTLKTNNEIALMVVYSSDGTILAHFKPDRIGRNMLDVDKEFGDSRREIFAAIENGKDYNGVKYDPSLDDNIRFMVKPVELSDSNYLSVLMGVSESYILRGINAMTRFTIAMAAIAVLAAAAVIIAIYGFVTEPIVTVTDTPKHVSGEKNITVNRDNGISVKSRENIEQLDRKVSLLKAA